MKSCLLSLLLLLTPFVSPAVQADTWPAGQGEINPAIAELDALLGGIDTFQADVQQIIVEASGGILEESEILFRLKRPDGFYWETLEPFPELIVTDGVSLWHYEPDLWQVTIEDWDAEQSELAAQLLGGRTDVLTTDYNVQRHESSSDARAEFILHPLDPASLYEQVSIYFEQGVLAAIHVSNTNGQRTLWQFHNQRVNQAIDDALFRFTMPDDDDIEVMDNRSASE